MSTSEQKIFEEMLKLKKSLWNCYSPTVNQLPDQDIYTSKNAESKLSELLRSLCCAEDIPILFSSLVVKRTHFTPSFKTDLSRMAYTVLT